MRRGFGGRTGAYGLHHQQAAHRLFQNDADEHLPKNLLVSPSPCDPSSSGDPR